ncbi:Holliday junction resolvase RuvX [Wenyingzhuangia sp. IMCC45574]
MLKAEFKILSIDYGTKKTGVAISDTSKTFAFALDTIATKELFAFLQKITKEEKIDTFVIGEPKQMDGSHSESEVHIKEFISKLEKTYHHIPIKRFDERFTSKMAFDTMLASGIGKKKRQNKGLVDKISATIILQEFLNTLQK